MDTGYRPDGIDFEVAAPGPALLVMPVNHALGLEARLGGAPAPVWRVNAALSGVLALFGLLAWALRRRRAGAAGAQGPSGTTR